jgi:hypothetical protein
VVNEREALLRSLTTVIRSPQLQAPGGSIPDRLRVWHSRTHADYLAALDSEAGQRQKWPVSPQANHYQLSYALKPFGQPITGGSFLDELGQVNSEVRDTVWTGWSMFYLFNRPEIAARFNVLHFDDEELEVVDANMIGEINFATTVPDFWRISRDGMASILRPYREDREQIIRASGELNPGTWFYPYVLVREIAEVLRHARALAKLLPDAQAVAFRGTWYGLKGRHIDNPNGTYSSEQVARVDTRTISGEWPLADIASRWPEIVAPLASTVTRLFDGLEISPEWIRSPGGKIQDDVKGPMQIFPRDRGCGGVPWRPGWGPASALEFSSTVEDD